MGMLSVCSLPISSSLKYENVCTSSYLLSKIHSLVCSTALAIIPKHWVERREMSDLYQQNKLL